MKNLFHLEQQTNKEKKSCTQWLFTEWKMNLFCCSSSAGKLGVMCFLCLLLLLFECGAYQNNTNVMDTRWWWRYQMGARRSNSPKQSRNHCSALIWWIQFFPFISIHHHYDKKTHLINASKMEDDTQMERWHKKIRKQHSSPPPPPPASSFFVQWKECFVFVWIEKWSERLNKVYFLPLSSIR